MEHPATASEFSVSRQMDFIVPLKQVGLITRAVLEAIRLLYDPRRILVVSSQHEGNILKQLLPHWTVGEVQFIAEETFFVANYNLQLSDIVAEYDATRPGDQREPGWWVQQLIKLGASTQIPDLSEYYVVWDGDLIPIRRWKLCDDEGNGRIKYWIAILQREARSQFNNEQYAACMEALTGFKPLDPLHGGTFVAHHMVFRKKYTAELLELMLQHTRCKEKEIENKSWPQLIMSYSRQFYRFSEYKTYCSFMCRSHADDFNYHPLEMFGEGGIRFRDANHIVKRMLTECPLSCGGLSYQQVKHFVVEKWQHNPMELIPPQEREQQRFGSMPAYIQLDHVYGFEGHDLQAFLSCGAVSCMDSQSSSEQTIARNSVRHDAEDIMSKNCSGNVSPSSVTDWPRSVCITAEDNLAVGNNHISKSTVGASVSETSVQDCAHSILTLLEEVENDIALNITTPLIDGRNLNNGNASGAEGKPSSRRGAKFLLLLLIFHLLCIFSTEWLYRFGFVSVVDSKSPHDISLMTSSSLGVPCSASSRIGKDQWWLKFFQPNSFDAMEVVDPIAFAHLINLQSDGDYGDAIATAFFQRI